MCTNSSQYKRLGVGLELGSVVLAGSRGSPWGTSFLPVDNQVCVQQKINYGVHT